MSSLSITPYNDHDITTNRAYTELSIHQVQHLSSKAYTMYCIIKRSKESCPRPVSHLSVDLTVLNARHSHDYEFANEYTLNCHRTSLLIYHLQIGLLYVLLHSQLIMASNRIAKLPRSQPPSACPNKLDNGLQVHF
jgi:hypothetical protein